MKNSFFKTAYILGAIMLASSTSFAQNGTVTISQDPEIVNLLEIKKELNKIDQDGDRYKINIFSGNRSGAENTKSSYDNVFEQWSSELVHETPNYKVYVGYFRSALERDRALRKIKRKFPNAFPFRFKKD